MNQKNVFRRLWLVFELFLFAGMAGLSLWLLYGYLREGTGTSENAAQTDSAGARINAPEAPETALTGTVKSGEEGAETENPDASQEGEAVRQIRVRILGDDYESDLFSALTVSCASAFAVTKECAAEADTEHPDAGAERIRESELTELEAGETFAIARGDAVETGDILRITSTDGSPLAIPSLSRACGCPEYAGTLLIYVLREGLALVNELPLEEYLYAVVPSEMPSDYPAEAQKAQAVCARTFALNCMKKTDAEEDTDEEDSADAAENADAAARRAIRADLDDSVNDQVYNNEKANETSRLAVDATRGEVLLLDTVQYYSTSCLTGKSKDLSDESAFRAFLQETPEEDAEYGSPWLRWETVLTGEQLLLALREQYGIQAETLQKLAVTERTQDGQTAALLVQTDEKSLTVEGAQAIRVFLSPGDQEVLLLDGTAAAGLEMLPSAYFAVDRTEEGTFRIFGGGFGHGEGMSQCGAAQMAKEGAGYREILSCYYGAEPVLYSCTE